MSDGSSLFANLRDDLPASVVVFFVALPLCLGIALASGAPLFAGLIAGVMGGIVVGALSGSPLGVSGPAAGLAVIVLTAIKDLGSFEAFLLAVVIAGAMQIALGFARAGVLGYFFPSAVIKGMLAGIGVIIVLKQLPHALGYDADPEGELEFAQADGETTFSALSQMLAHIDFNAITVAVGALVIVLVWDKLRSKSSGLMRLLPGTLMAVAAGIVYQYLSVRYAPTLALSPEHLVSVPVATDWQAFTALFTFPDWSRLNDPAIYLAAATLAVIASLETLLCVEATDKLDPQKRVTPTNRELLAQGTGNILSGLIGGLPVTQVIVRSSANIQTGARSKLSAIVHGVLLLVCVLALPRVLNMIPLAVLATVLILVGYKLAHPSLFRAMFALGPTQAVPFFVTVAGVVLTDLLTGISLGMAVAVLFILHRNYQNSHFMHIESHPDPDQRPVVTMHLAEDVTFLNKGAILKELSGIADRSRVVIDTSDCVNIDYDAREIIDDFRASAAARGIDVTIIEPQPARP
jgi:MFS superfamily sulfate permease-like transporter